MAPLPLQELELGGYWTQAPYMQRSAQDDIQSKLWDKHIGKSGKIWLLPHNEEANTMVIVEGGPNSDGFGGAELTFNLFGGGEIKLKGPWSSNYDSLFDDTGIDRRNRFRSWGCIGRHRSYHTSPGGYDSRAVICDLLYWDPEGGLIGSYDRIERMAQRLAYQRDEVLFKFQGHYGGSLSGSVFPYEGTEEYRLYRQNIRSWRRQYQRKTDYHYWVDLQKPYWDRYESEFVSQLELDARGIYAKPLLEVPLDEELELNPPQPKKETYGSGDGTDMDIDWMAEDYY
jgi:hypothetical protein